MEYKKKYLKYKEKYLQIKEKLYGGTLQETHEKFKTDIINPDIILGVYALAAPDNCASTNMKLLHFERIQNIVKECNPDALIVYDVQDEKCRDGKDRPFKFNKKEQSDIFASFISKKFNKTNIITYRVLPNEDTKEEDLNKFIDSTINKPRELKNIVYASGSKGIVGESRLSPYNYALERVKINNTNVIIGGITLPERYKKEGWDEAEILFKKTQEGCKFFVSQVVYNFNYIETLLKNYAYKIKQNKIEPSRIIFTFALFGESKTFEFMSCLGIDIPDDVKTEVAKIKEEKDYISYSKSLCLENWEKILKLRNQIMKEGIMNEGIMNEGINLPIGFSADVISGNKAEFENSIKLYNELNELKKSYYELKKN